MGPHGSGRYGYHDMKSSEALQDSDEDEDDYYEEDSHEKHHFYRQHHDERQMSAFGEHHHQSSICDILNVFDDEGSGNRSSMDHLEEYHRKDKYRHQHRGSLKGPSSRKLKAKLKLEDLDIGEESRGKKGSEN